MKNQLSILIKGTSFLVFLLFASTLKLMAQALPFQLNMQNAIYNTSFTPITSINTGSTFIYQFGFSTEALRGAGNNVEATLVLPANVEPINTSQFSQISNPLISSVTYTSATKTIKVTFINPLPAGSATQVNVSLRYTNGTTPNGYEPNLISTATYTNPGTGSNVSNNPTVEAVASKKLSLTKTQPFGGALNDLTIYKIELNNPNNSGTYEVLDPILRDTLPAGVDFIEAQTFGGTPASDPPTFNPGTRIITWTWPSGSVLPLGYNKSVLVSVQYNSPTFAVNNNTCNSATLNGTVPILPLGSQTPTSSTGKKCIGIEAPNAKIVCTGGSITAATANWLNKHVLAGTSGNTFSNGWSNADNAANTEIDTVELTIGIDKHVDVSNIFLGTVSDPYGRKTKVKVEVSFRTNSNLNFTLYNSYTVFNSSQTQPFPTAPSGQYVTEVRYKIWGVDTKLPIGSSQSFTYNGSIRTSAQGAKDGSVILEGTTYNPSNPGDDGTLISNNSYGRFVYNGVSTNYSNCGGQAEIMIERPVFGSISKYTNNGTSFRASDTINYQIKITLGGNLNPQNVVVVDTLDSRLTYISGSSSIIIGSNTITPTVNGQLLVWNLGTLPATGDYYINFKAAIAPGIPAATIRNTMKVYSDHPSIFPNGDSDWEDISIITSVAIVAYKGQNGCDPGFAYWPAEAITKEGDLINYKITIKNLGNVAARDMSFIDVFPFIGDVRGSQWFANLVGPVTLSDPSSTVYYNTVANPCYADFVPAVNPPGCNGPVWSLTPPVNITSVTAIKVTRSVNLPALDSIVFEWPMRVPVGTPANIVMNNTIYYQVSRADIAGTAGRLLPASPNLVGMRTSCAPLLGSLGDYVWIDLNKDGIQNESASLGLNGVKVYLFGAGPDNAIGGGDDVLLDSTFTGNNFSGNPGYYKFVDLVSGKYYVKFQTSFEQYLLTPVNNQHPQTNGNNDADALGLSGLVTIDANGTGLDKDNPSIDAGYYPIGSLGNYVWNDFNANGLQDEPANKGINGKKVYLFKDNGSGFEVIDSTITANDGSGNPGYYNFIITTSGNYRVQFPVGGLTTQNVSGSTINSDPNVSTGFTNTIVMNLIGTGLSVNNPTIDAGYICSPNSSLTVAYICAGSSYSFNGNTYTTSGSYAVVLTNVDGCDSTANLNLTVVPIPSSTFTVNDASQCANNNTYTITVTAPQASVKYIVNFGDGTIDTSFVSNRSHTYTTPGSYTISVKALDTLAACHTSSYSTVVVYNVPVVKFNSNDSTQCVGGNLFTLFNTSSVVGGTISNTYWNFGDGTDTTVSGNSPVLKRYAASGIYYVKAYATSNLGCTGVDSIHVNALPGPIANFSMQQLNCCGEVQITNLSQNARYYEWEFASVSSSYVFKCTYSTNTFNVALSAGSYNVRLIAHGDGDCVDTLYKTITVLPKPVAVFSPVVNACGTDVKFNNYSFGAVSYSWNFGEPASGAANTSTLAEPSHLYIGAGSYQVTLIVTNAGGCKDTLVRTVVVNPALGINPVASFTQTVVGSGCANKIRFSSTSSNAASVKWLFADGTSSNESEVNKTFASAGSYTVKLVATSSTGCVDTATQVVNVGSNSNGPLASFTVMNNNQCLKGNSYNFINTSTFVGSGWIPSYSWDFGDGTQDNVNSFAYNKVYANAGTYLVRLIATAANGCKDTAYNVVVVKPSPVSSFTTGSTCGRTISFTNTTPGSIGSIWNMGDGGVPCTDASTIVHQYSNTGWYDVKLINVGENGCLDTLVKPINVNPSTAPVANFTYSVENCSKQIKFTNTSSGGGVYSWNFGDGSPLNTTTAPFHGYTAAGTYNVTLVASTGFGCADTITLPVTAPKWEGIYKPIAKFGHSVEACTNTITATGTSTGVTMQQWLWDGSVYAWGPTVTIPSPAPGGHLLQYVVGNGVCTDTLGYTFIIQAAPEAGFDLVSSTCSNSIQVFNTSKNANTMKWDFGVSSTTADTALGSIASYTYAANGTYTIRLIATNDVGCSDTIEKPVTVTKAFNPHIASFTYDNSLCNCKCQNLVRFQNTTTDSGNVYLWSFGDGSTSTQRNPSKGFPTAGTYQVTLTSVDPTGCMSTVSKPITIVSGLKGPSASFNTDYQVQCISNNNFNFYNTSSFMGQGWNKKYYWNFGDGTIDTTNTFVFNKKYSNPGNYAVSLVAEGNEGCRDTMTMYVQVRSNPCTGVLKTVNLADGSNWNVTPQFGGGYTTGIAKQSKEIELGLYPNPNDGSFSLQFSESIYGNFNLELRDMTGRLVYEQAEIGKGVREVSVSAAGISEGTYFVRVITEEGTTMEKKFVVVK